MLTLLGHTWDPVTAAFHGLVFAPIVLGLLVVRDRIRAGVERDS